MRRYGWIGLGCALVVSIAVFVSLFFTGPDAVLKKAVQGHFREELGASAEVRVSLLRQGATVTGVASPKYYVWAEVFVPPSTTPARRAALRLAMVDDQTCEVLGVLTQEEIISSPERVRATFPAALVPRILELARP